MYMPRMRYWKLTIEEVEKLSYDESKVLNWEIKCTREPEEEAKFVGVFLYKNGTPKDYVSVKGITYYHNNIDPSELSGITKFLKNKFGGKIVEKGERVFLELAQELESKLNAKAIITIEFQDISEQEQNDAGLPEAKLLPIPSK